MMTAATNPVVRALVFAAHVLLPAIACGASVPGQGTWETTLQPRDLDSNGTADAYYDTALNITWLRDANVSGQPLSWTAAIAWASALVVGNYGGWRLPTMVDTFVAPVNGSDGCNFSFSGGTDCGYNVQTKSGGAVYSEMAHLFYATLGNKSYCPPGDATCAGAPQVGWGLTNTANFSNMQLDDYWSGLEYAIDANRAWYFVPRFGSQLQGGKGSGLYAMAVHSGDVGAPIPEPGIWVMLLAGLSGLAVARRLR